MNDIIRGMFHNQGNFRSRTKPEDPKNWRGAQNIVWGGINHQHPHCDQGKAGCFLNEAVFPFVCIHGFGVHEFVLWLLPARKKREYGFPYRFSKKAIVFMRGDMIHAGGCMQPSRAHMEFYPLPGAGWKRSQNPYWSTPERFKQWQEKKNTFVVPDFRTFPFAFPVFGPEGPNGDQEVTYPSSFTEDLLPFLHDTKRDPQWDQMSSKRKRKLKEQYASVGKQSKKTKFN